MRGHRPNRPTGTGKWAVFDQAVWDELFSGQNRWHDSPTIKVVDSSIGRWLNAKLSPVSKLEQVTPGFFLLQWEKEVPAPYSLSDYNATLSAVLSGVASVDMTSPAHIWANNIPTDPDYWPNLPNAGLPEPHDLLLPNRPPLYWEQYQDPGCNLDYGDNWCNSSTWPNGQYFPQGTGTIAGAGKGLFAGVYVSSSNGIGSTGVVWATRWRLNGYSPGSFKISLVSGANGYPTGSPAPLSFGGQVGFTLGGPNLNVESTSTLTPIGRMSQGWIYALDGVPNLGSLSIPNSTNPFSIERGQWAYTEAFDNSTLPTSTDPTVTVTASPGNASCGHTGGSNASFTCAGTFPAGFGYVLGYVWLISTDSGTNWIDVQSFFGGGAFGSASGYATSTVTITPTTTLISGSLIKCQIYTFAGMAATGTAILTVT